MSIRKLAVILAALAVTAGLAGCGAYGESHNHNAPPPVTDVQLTWTRLESPGNYHTIIWACHGRDGVYLTQADNNSVTVVPDDPECQGR